MSKRPQFTLKAILVIITVLSVPFAMIVSGNTALSYTGFVILLNVAFFSLSYLLSPWTLTSLGKAVAAFVLLIVLLLLLFIGLICLPH